jgi:hypothetical protein
VQIKKFLQKNILRCGRIKIVDEFFHCEVQKRSWKKIVSSEVITIIVEKLSFGKRAKNIRDKFQRKIEMKNLTHSLAHKQIPLCISSSLRERV